MIGYKRHLLENHHDPTNDSNTWSKYIVILDSQLHKISILDIMNSSGKSHKIEMPPELFNHFIKNYGVGVKFAKENKQIVLNQDLPDKLYAMKDRYTYDKYLDWREDDYSVPDWMIQLGMIKATTYYYYSYEKPTTLNRPLANEVRNTRQII